MCAHVCEYKEGPDFINDSIISMDCDWEKGIQKFDTEAKANVNEETSVSGT